MPKITALMPLFNGKKFIRESVESIQRQSFTDWEFIIVNDFESNDGCAEIVRQYAAKDPRIVLIQAEKRLGLAESLNLGLDMAKGKYVARVDVDDPSEQERFEKQLKYMETNPEVTLCSTWQRCVTPQKSFVQKVAYKRDELKAAMLFGCEISHCGVMLRKASFDTHGWRYDSSYLGEDYELWTRMLMEGAVIENIPEALVNHRWGFDNISITKGERLRIEARTVSARLLKSLGIQVDRYSQYLFSGWRSCPEVFAKANYTLFLQQGYQLIQEILEKNHFVKFCAHDALCKILFDRWNWIKKSCGISFQEWKYKQFETCEIRPVVSVILPSFCSAKDISKAIDSVQAQTYTDWELLVINEHGSNDGTAELVKMYSWNDSRVRLIQAEQKLGLADSLNLGMRIARGKYLARLDADDTSKPERFAKQVAYLDAHSKVGICGTWQHHYGKNADWIHKAAVESNLQKCRLLFWCDLCHSTLMLRRDMFLEHQLFYDPTVQAEDFELWTRAMDHMDIINLPEILGEYHEGTGITSQKIQNLADESGRLTACTLQRIFGINIPVDQHRLLNTWINPIAQSKNRQNDLYQLRGILSSIWEENKKVKYFNKKVLLETLAAKYHWAANGVDWRQSYKSVKTIEEALDDKFAPSLFDQYRTFCANNPDISIRVKKIIRKFILRPSAHLVRGIVKNLFRDCIDEINHNIVNKKIEQVIEKNNAVVQYVPYYEDSKVRVVFLFQVASFWPAQESVYRSVLSDSRFEVKLVCYDEPFDKTIKTETARMYLIEQNYDYVSWNEFDIEKFNPHIVFLQTAYDSNRRREFKSKNLCQRGFRIIYIPYGIEIADTSHAHRDHFKLEVVQNSWKIYTFSERMRQDYFKYLPVKKDVCVFGLPRFDALYYKNQFSPIPELIRRASGRKIVLWKVHFPKIIRENGEMILVTPYIREYIKFAEQLDEYTDLFFVFMPHPRFKEFNEDVAVQRDLLTLYNLLENTKHVYIDTSDDYRNSLVHADYVIVDRSAVMVEAGSLGIPVLYMYNADYKEPMTEAVKPLIESYYQGVGYEDIKIFLNMCRACQDPKKDERIKAFEECVPYFDGMCGERIKENILYSLKQETMGSALNSWLVEQNTQLEKRIAKLEKNLTSSIDKSVERWTWERYLRIRKWNENLLKYKPRVRMQRLTVHLTEHCNLNCQCCDNFSPIANEEYTDITATEKDFSRLFELFGDGIGAIELSGGEALLHPRVCDFFTLTRKYFQSTDIQLVTNGILLQTMPDAFWEACHQNAITVVITKYPIKLDINYINEKAKKHSVFWRYYSEIEIKTSFLLPLDVRGKKNGRVNFVNCFHANECIYLCKGRIYTCSVAANIRHFNAAFGEKLPDVQENSIDIYEVQTAKEIFDFLCNPIPLCDYCDVAARKFGLPWGISKREKREWMNIK